MAESPPQCAACGKSAVEAGFLRRCANCQTTQYCSRDCQKNHWKDHKKTCSQNAAARTGAPASSASASNSGPNPSSIGSNPKGLSSPFDKPFNALNDKKYLHDRPEQDVFKLLIDCYRLRMDDDSKFSISVDSDSIYGGARDGIAGFQRLLRTASTRDGLLPEWWSTAKAEQCVQVGRDDGWSSLSKKIAKADVISHYGDADMPMQLRYLGEQILGTGPGGQSGTAMITMKMMMEGSRTGNMATTQFDISQVMR